MLDAATQRAIEDRWPETDWSGPSQGGEYYGDDNF